MSRTTRHVQCRPDEVFAVLADGWSYASWVVGAARIRDVDADWPAVGSRIHHSVGLWPALLSDTTSVEGADAPREMLLRVRAWPAGEGRVRIRCEADPAGGTTVTMEEWAVSGPATLVPTAVQDPALHARNTEALRRLAYLAEGGARPPHPERPPAQSLPPRREGVLPLAGLRVRSTRVRRQRHRPGGEASIRDLG